VRKLRAARRLRANPPQYTHGVSRARKASAQEASRNAGMSEECAAVLARIRSAQDGGAGHGGTYASALLEFQAGAKTGHYIWWIWPSLRGVRSTSRPEYELPSFACARAYLQDATLRGRLLEITAAAVAHLEAGVPREVLFGAMHRYDAPKFVEAMTLFSAAAACEGLAGPFSALVAGLCATGSAPHGPTLALIGLPPAPAGALETYALRYDTAWAAPRLHVRVAGGWRPLEAAVAFQREGGHWLAELSAPPGAPVAVLPFCGSAWDHAPGGGEYRLEPGVSALSCGTLSRPEG
jgi:uncharacterized protein (DUF1810 family)